MRTVETPCLLLKTKYDLHKSPEVEAAARRIGVLTGEKIPQNPLARIQNYLDRFEEVISNNDPKLREAGINAIKKILYDKNVIKPNEIPESYFETQKRLARELGHGDIEINPKMRKQLTRTVIADQKSSLDTWINYLTSNDASYPNSLKYFALRSVLDLGEYDKEKKVFTQRSKGTVKPFVELNPEALEHTLNALGKKYDGQAVDLTYLPDADKEQFKRLLRDENFAKLYALRFEKETPESKELLTDTRGSWKKYNMGSDPKPLATSLEGHCTGWCTAGSSTAEMQLRNGDFYVYHSFDKDQKPSIPRVAIRMEGYRIGEIRGIAKNQNLDPYIGPVVEEKLKDFHDGEIYKKRVHDMKLLTEIDKKNNNGINLTKQDVELLYEVNEEIKGFGYGRDPRIDELRSQRNPEEDMQILLGCSKDQIAHHESEINQNTKAYLGYLEAGIFDKWSKPLEENSYISFPGEKIKIRRDTATTGGKTSSELLDEMRKRKVSISPNSDKLIRSENFNLSTKLKDINLIILKIGNFGLENPTTLEIYSRAEALGLKLCTLEIAAHYRLAYINQPMGEHLFVSMIQVNDRLGNPSILQLGHNKDGLRLRGHPASSNQRWDPESKFIFQY
jgi:hypothetical protein